MMNAAPDPGQLLEFESALDQAPKAGRGSHELIELAVPLLQSAWPAIRNLRVYASADTKLQLVASTDKSRKTATQDDLESAGAVCLPLTDDYLLAAEVDETVSGAAQWLAVLAEPLARRLHPTLPRKAYSPGGQVSMLHGLNELSAAIAAASTEEQLLRLSVQVLVKVLGLDYGQVCLLGRDAGGHVVSEYPAEGDVGRHLSADELLMGDLDELDRAKLIANVAISQRVPDSRRADLEAQQVSSMLLLPLALREELVAYVRLDSRQPQREISQEMAEIAQTFLAQIVVGLQNIRLLNESQRRSDQLQQLSGFAQALQLSLEIAAVLRTALDETQHVLPLEWMQILLFDDQSDSLREVALCLPDNPDDSHIKFDKGALVPLGEKMLATRVWKNQAFLHVSDASRASWVLPESATGLRSLLTAPLRTLNKQLGIVSLGQSQPFCYSETDAIVFQQLADQLATAIENAQFYERNQRDARDEALINDIAVRLQQQGEVENMLHIVAQDLGKALGARRARIRLGTEHLVFDQPDAEQNALE